MSKDKSVAQMQREILAKIGPKKSLELCFIEGSYQADLRAYPDRVYDSFDSETFEGLIEKIYSEVVLGCKS